MLTLDQTSDAGFPTASVDSIETSPDDVSSYADDDDEFQGINKIPPPNNDTDSGVKWYHWT